MRNRARNAEENSLVASDKTTVAKQVDQFI